MRRACVVAGIGALALSAVGGEQARGAHGRCDGPLPAGPAGLPAPIVVTTRCGRFRLERSGEIVHTSSRTLPVPKGSNYFLDLTWYRFSGHHLLIGRGMRQLWRSHERFPATHPGDLGLIALGRRSLAFSYFGSSSQKKPRLYVARYGGGERFVARGEDPVALLSGRLVTARWDHALVLRSASGRLLRLAAPHAIDPQWDRGGGRVVFRVGHELRAFDGQRVRELANRYALGVRGNPVVEPLGPFVALHDRSHLALLGYSGRLVASAALPKPRTQDDGIVSDVESNGAGTAVAFTATRRWNSRETVYVLRAGARRAQPVFRTQPGRRGCGFASSLAWHGAWLLYSNGEALAAVVDSRRAAAVRLGSAVTRLPGWSRDGLFNIGWAPAP